jgi:hypothetical protein
MTKEQRIIWEEFALLLLEHFSTKAYYAASKKKKGVTSTSH